MPISPDVAHLRAVAAANDRWKRPGAREAQSAKLREARLRFYEDKVDPDRSLDPAERLTLAENALRADMARLALASAKARRARKGGGDLARMSTQGRQGSRPQNAGGPEGAA